MNANATVSLQLDPEMDDFVAELIAAAVPVTLRYGVGQRWLDMELDLYQAMSRVAKQWEGRGHHAC
jgi:hypothetical protein